MRLQGLTIGLTLILTACNSGTEFEKEIKSLEQTRDEVVQETEKLKSLDSAKIVKMYDDYTHSVSTFKTYYLADTVDPVLGRRMNMYKGLKSMRDASGKLALMKRESNAIVKQLEDLAHDLEHNLIEADSAKSYVERELATAQQHLSLIKDFKIYIDDLEANYDTLNPIISVYVDSLIRVNEESPQ